MDRVVAVAIVIDAVFGHSEAKKGMSVVFNPGGKIVSGIGKRVYTLGHSEAKKEMSAVFILVAIFSAASITLKADKFQYDGKNYSFSIDGVPDFDQKRAPSGDGSVKGLPNEGKMYCVPTSALNWMAYIAEHGYPTVGPGPAPSPSSNWAVSPPVFLDDYNFITGNLFLLGFLMLTSPEKGTSGDNAAGGMQIWLDAASPGNFVVIRAVAKDDWSPRARDASLLAMFGGLVNVGMGWYTNADEPKAHMRKGGHAVTLVAGADEGSSNRFLGLNDPARGADDVRTTQSPFAASNTGFHGETQYFCWSDANGFPTGCVERTQDRLTYTGKGYMDGYNAIIPKYGLSFSINELLLLKPIQLAGKEGRKVLRFPAPAGGKILDVALNPTRVKQPFLVEGSDAVWQIDMLTGMPSEFTKTVPGPRHLAYGSNESLFVLTPNQLQGFDRDGRCTCNITLRHPLDAIAFDDQGKVLVGLSRSDGQAYLFDPWLKSLGSVHLPAGVLGTGGQLTLSFNPSTGDAWTIFEGARYISRFKLTPGADSTTAKQIVLPDEVAHPQGLYVDEKGNLFVTSDGSIYPLDENGRLMRESPFFGLPAGNNLQIVRPFSNFDPTQHVGPSWIHVLPEDAESQ